MGNNNNQNQPDVSKTQQATESNEPAAQGADSRTHGAHGKGDTREAQQQATAPQPDGSTRTPAALGNLPTASSGWGSAASGGSTTDKRSPKKKK